MKKKEPEKFTRFSGLDASPAPTVFCNLAELAKRMNISENDAEDLLRRSENLTVHQAGSIEGA